MDTTQLEQLNMRLEKLEKRDMQDLLTLLEIMSNVYFFGGMKKTNCQHAKNGQCSLFYFKEEAKSKVPVATECRISECSTHDHCHLEISDVTCTFCPHWNNNQTFTGKVKLPAHQQSRNAENSSFASKQNV
jgi:hypothetical protein